MTILLLNIDENGEASQSKGVVFLPNQPLPQNFKEGDPIFTLRLSIPGAGKVARDGIVWFNLPKDGDTPFDRAKYTKTVIPHSFTSNAELDFKIYAPGSYNYYISYRDSETNTLKTTRKFYVVVPPQLYLNGEFVPLNSVALESIISKWLGPRLDWESVFDEVKSKGYNMIHFTPLQERGESNSPYSIFDQLTFDPLLFKDQEDVEKLIRKLHNEKGLLSITDIVFNHTANNSAWLRDYPDAGYNAKTAPHLTSAIELDGRLLEFSDKLAELKYPTELKSVEDLLNVMDGIKEQVFGQLKLWEFYVVDVEQTLRDLEQFWKSTSLSQLKKVYVPEDVKNDLAKLGEFVSETAGIFTLQRRHDNKVDIFAFASILNGLYDGASYVEIENEAKKILNQVNLPRYNEYDSDVEDILEQLFNRIKYLRIDDHGPKLGPISSKSPLTEPYFTRFTAADGEEYQLANNGWIWNGNPLIDFASNKTKSYLLREVIIWGDCVKLRYGDGPEDSPYLWSRIKEYVRINATVFDGFRIDNSHSTPLHVGEYFLDYARSVKPNLYVVAELFTGSEDMDNLFVERLGISSLIREAMQAWSVDELSRLVHRHAGLPIGSFQPLPLDKYAYPAYQSPAEIGNTISNIELPITLERTRTHALFMDCTHDNETPYTKRTVEDTLPNAALVSLCYTAVGSVFGYDECYPKLLDVVNEKRTYTFGSGIGKAKAKLYELRQEISRSCYNTFDHQMHVHHEGQFITLQRVNAKNGNGIFLIARTKFSEEQHQSLEPIVLKGTTAKFEFSYALAKTGEPEENKDLITPIPVELRELQPPKIEAISDNTKITLPADFPQGAILVLRTSFHSIDEDLDQFLKDGALDSTTDLTLYDLNVLLYKCESEERDASAGTDGCYVIPNHGRLVYAGLHGWISLLSNITGTNDLAHPLAENLRNGNWALDFTTARLQKYSDGAGIDKFRNWLEEKLNRIKTVPFFLVPRYFALVIGVSYEALRLKALSLMSGYIQESNLFVQSLSLTSIQMVGKMRSTSLNPNDQTPSLAAGLPHFSYDYMRCWGRDVFISVRGLLLATGRFEDAKSHILNFASTLKHGLIPNLLDAGRNPRYNARDAAFFFLQSIQDYISIVPSGENILKEKVKRRFPLDDRYITHTDPEAFSYETSIEDVIYEILSRHAQGIKYREANAGPRLDSQMKDEGFNVEIHVEWETGLIHGGSQFNCGTWMDKMGESERAHSKGVPGTPRDGAAIEISGLLKSTLRFLIELNEKGLFKYTSIPNTSRNGDEITLKEWNKLIQENFERVYFIPLDPKDDNKHDVDPNIINRRGIYKDLYRSSKPYEDYQLRPNFAIAMTVAPELFNLDNALSALKIADTAIRGPIGMRTLDPSDLNYRPYYRNSEDSDDFSTSKGRNYHQGPEWVWCLGFFLRAWYKFHKKDPSFLHSNGSVSSELTQKLSSKLSGPRAWISESEWAGLTELTNKNGELCPDSSPTQAWSSSCLLDLFLDVWNSS